MAQTSWTGLLAGSSSPLLASGDVLAFVDISDTTQSGSGSLVKITLTDFFANVPVPVVVTSASANALAVGRQGTTNPAFLVNASAGLSATGLSVTAQPAASGCGLAVISSGTDENLTISAKGAGTITIGANSTGAISLQRAVTTGSTINGQTISSPASFTGSVTAATNITASTGNLVATLGAMSCATTITTGAPSGSTARAWRLGDVNVVAPTAPNRTIAVTVNGTVYYIAAKTTND